MQEFSLQTQEVHRGYVELVERLLEEHIVAGLGLALVRIRVVIEGVI